MPECANKGCTNKARHTVGFVDPEEILEYCMDCAVYEYKRNERSVGVMPKDN